MAHRPLTGALLVGGASTRFGTPKALARLGGATLAEHAWRLLGEACDERLAVGKNEYELPFPVLDDGSAVRAPLAGVVAALRAARHERCLVVPVDMPLLTVDALHRLAASRAEVAHPQRGPLPGVYARSTLPVLEQALAEGRLALRAAIGPLGVEVVELDERVLVNVNEPVELEGLERMRPFA